MGEIKPSFPKARVVSSGDDRKVLSGIIHVFRYGLPWDATPIDGPYKTLYNHFRRWLDNGVFQLIFSGLARSDGTEPRGTDA